MPPDLHNRTKLLASAKLCLSQDEASVTSGRGSPVPCWSLSPGHSSEHKDVSSTRASPRTCCCRAGQQGSSWSLQHRSPAHGCRTIGHLTLHTMATMRQSHTMTQPRSAGASGHRRRGCSACATRRTLALSCQGRWEPSRALPGCCVGRTDSYWM